MNLKSKLLNLSAIARLIGSPPPALYNQVHGIGRHKALSKEELKEIKTLIKKDLKI